MDKSSKPIKNKPVFNTLYLQKIVVPRGKYWCDYQKKYLSKHNGICTNPKETIYNVKSGAEGQFLFKWGLVVGVIMGF